MKPLARITVPTEEHRTVSADTTVVDQESHRLYLSDNTLGADFAKIQVFDISVAPARFVISIVGLPPDKGPSTGFAGLVLGLALAPAQHRLYAGLDGGSIQIIDTTTNQTIEEIPADDPKPNDHPFVGIHGAIRALSPQRDRDRKLSGPMDLIEYEATNQHLYASEPDDGYLIDIDTRTNHIQAIGGGANGTESLGFLGQPRYNTRDHMVYVASGDFNTLIKVDPTTDKVVHIETLQDQKGQPVICTPHGLAISPKTNEGLIGCQDREESRVLVWDFTTQRTVDQFDLSGSGDMVLYEPKVDQFFFAAQNFQPSELSIFSASPHIAYVTSVPTTHKSKMVGYDEAHDILYTVDGIVREAGLWAFANPTLGKS